MLERQGGWKRVFEEEEIEGKKEEKEEKMPKSIGRDD